MNKKVETIKEYLPEEFPKMLWVYSILSKWVHELSEEECKDYFDIMKLSIELILDKKVEMRMKEERDKLTEQILQKSLKEISKK